MSTLEADTESKLLKWCQKRDILYLKFIPKGNRGWPDRVCILPDGTHIWLELKKEGEAPRELQEYRLDQLRKREVIAVWADNVKDATILLESYLWSGDRKGITRED